MFHLVSRPLSRAIPRTSFLPRAMASSAAPTFKPFNLALIQLGQVGADKDGASFLARLVSLSEHSRAHISKSQTC